MQITENEGKITVYLEGRIDTNNAPQVEKEIFDTIGDKTPDIVIDAQKLEYISSAGLRVLMKLRKSINKPLPVINVSRDVYDIFETTGFIELFDIKKALRKVSVEGCELIGEGGNGAVYRLDEDKIVKVYKPWMKQEEIERERSFAKTALVNGVPSVIAYDMVRVDDCFGIVFEMLHSDTLGHAMRDNPAKFVDYVDQYVALARTLHSTHVPKNSFTTIQEVMHGKADNLTRWCSPEEIALLHGIIDSIPETDTITHNDLHPGNIMIQDGELVLIDMPEVTMGPPVCDLTAIFRDMISAPKSKPDIIERSVGMPPEMIMKAGNLFFMKYNGFTDGTQLEEYYKKLGLLYAFNVVLIPGSGSEDAVKNADIIMNNLLRGVVIPNEQAIKGLFRIM